MTPDPLDAPVLVAFPGARRVAEVAAGRRFDLALAFAERGADVLVTDVDPGVLEAPSPLRAALDDLVRPDRALYAGSDLVVARRLPEELQRAAWALARDLGAPLAFRPLKDEEGEWGPARVRRLAGGWRVLARS
ncbi:MAG TPA: UPF0146 family protein [Candidatus Thermoplasmatota archaeon]|nr:UPF0146 family protein [Candidatus Thermoplasmatota archaeon]